EITAKHLSHLPRRNIIQHCSCCGLVRFTGKNSGSRGTCLSSETLAESGSSERRFAMSNWNNTPVKLTGRVFLHRDCIPTHEPSKFKAPSRPARGAMLLRHSICAIPRFSNQHGGTLAVRVFDGSRWRTVRLDGSFTLKQLQYKSKPGRWGTAEWLRKQLNDWR